jgi:hypothetical protein
MARLMRAPKRRRGAAPTPKKTAGDYIVEMFQGRFGWRPSTVPFHTTAKRECGSCQGIKPGSAFDLPLTRGEPDLNLCRGCGDAE